MTNPRHREWINRNTEPSPKEKNRRRAGKLRECREFLRKNLDVPGTPGVGWAHVIRHAGMPFVAGDVVVLDVDVTEGDPGHGELRSDDHVSRFEVTVPFGRDLDQVPAGLDHCPGCGFDRVAYQYSAYHHIAGSEAVYCPDCNHEYYSEDWG